MFIKYSNAKIDKIYKKTDKKLEVIEKNKKKEERNVEDDGESNGCEGCEAEGKVKEK
jgi:hypothetical protein